MHLVASKARKDLGKNHVQLELSMGVLGVRKKYACMYDMRSQPRWDRTDRKFVNQNEC